MQEWQSRRLFTMRAQTWTCSRESSRRPKTASEVWSSFESCVLHAFARAFPHVALRMCLLVSMLRGACFFISSACCCAHASLLLSPACGLARAYATAGLSNPHAAVRVRSSTIRPILRVRRCRLLRRERCFSFACSCAHAGSLLQMHAAGRMLERHCQVWCT